jgi:hypothetical protein
MHHLPDFFFIRADVIRHETGLQTPYTKGVSSIEALTLDFVGSDEIFT